MTLTSLFLMHRDIIAVIYLFFLDKAIQTK